MIDGKSEAVKISKLGAANPTVGTQTQRVSTPPPPPPRATRPPQPPAPSPDHVTQGTVWRLSAQIGIYMFSKPNEWLGGGGMRGSPWGSFRLPPDCNSRVKGPFRCRSWGNSDEDLNSPPQTWPAIVGVVESDVNGCRSGGIEPSPATTKREGS